MPGEQNKPIIRRFFEELWNDRKLEVADEIFSPECVTHQLQSGSEDVAVPRNAEAVKEHIQSWLQGFPDLKFAIEKMFTDQDYVITYAVMTGTHTGNWHGISPTGKKITIKMFVTHQVMKGKIVADWVIAESLGFFQQLGLLPATE